MGRPHYEKDGTFSMIYSMKEYAKSHTFKAKHFIQGFDFESRDKQHLGIRHHSTSFEDRKAIFKFVNKDTITIISSFTISVICFNSYSPGVLYAEGTIEQNFVSSKL